MPRFAANLSMLFNEYPFIERFDRAALAGFEAIEFMFPYAEDIPAVRDALTRNNLAMALFNLPPGDWAAGERGIASDPRRIEEFRESLKRALEIAVLLDAEKLNCLAGLRINEIAPDVQLGTYKENLAYAADRALTAGIKLVFEPLNPFDNRGFFLDRASVAFEIARELNHPNLGVQYDVYHAQRTEGNLADTIKQNCTRIGHVQIADSPYRHEPGTGEINYPYVLATLDEAGYVGWVGLEYRPLQGTEYSLRWLREWGYWR
jgi:hydroxypyruvate isomerase